MVVLTIPQIKQMVHQLDPNHEPELFPVACIILDMTLNSVHDPMRLAIRHGLTYNTTYKYVSTLKKKSMTRAHWLTEEGINVIEFWLHVMVAIEQVDVKQD